MLQLIGEKANSLSEEQITVTAAPPPMIFLLFLPPPSPHYPIPWSRTSHVYTLPRLLFGDVLWGKVGGSEFPISVSA